MPSGMTCRELESGERFEPNTLILTAPFTQSVLYGQWQQKLGRRVRRFVIVQDDREVGFFQLIVYPLFRGKTYCYMPYGPVVKMYSPDLFLLLKKELQRIAREERAVFVRLDFTPPPLGTERYFKRAPRYTYHGAYFQPRTEWVLPLEKPAQELLAAMDKKTRYSIRTAETKGVTVTIVTDTFERYLEPFYALMRETALRNRFSLHEKKYYESVFQNLKENSFLAVAALGDQLLAIDVVVVYGTVAHYVFGGSSNAHRSICPSYLAKWHAIIHAKHIGCTQYNFGGISSNGDVHGPWKHLTAFKQKFGGEELRHAEFFDYVAEPLWYWLYAARKRVKSLGI